jgi:hypothetical protein
LAALWTEIAERRAASMRPFVADLPRVGRLRLQVCERFLAGTWQRMSPSA